MTNPMSDDIRRILEGAQARKRMQRVRDCPEQNVDTTNAPEDAIDERDRSELNVDTTNAPEDAIDEPSSSEHSAESDKDDMAMIIRPDQTLRFPHVPVADVAAHPRTNQLHQTNNSYHFNPVQNFNINCTDADTVKRFTIGGNKPNDPARGWQFFFRFLGLLYSWLPYLAILAVAILIASCAAHFILHEQADTQARLINIYRKSLVSPPDSWREGVCRWVHSLGLCTPEPTSRERMQARWQTLYQTLDETIAKLEGVHKNLSSAGNTLSAEGTSLEFDISEVVAGMKDTCSEAIEAMNQINNTMGNATAKKEAQKRVAPVSAVSDLLGQEFEDVGSRKKELDANLREYIEALQAIKARARSQVKTLKHPGRDGAWELELAREQMGEDLDKWVELGEMLLSTYIRE